MKRLYKLYSLAGFFLILSGCSKNDKNNQITNTVIDIDGNVYHSIEVGTQLWLVENLKTTRYRNGDQIPVVNDDAQWRNLTSGAACNINNDAAMGNKYGKLYNWYAVNDGRSIAPVGWHVPTDAEWTLLETYVANNLNNLGTVAQVLGSKTDWNASIFNGAVGFELTKNNSSGFSALPGGVRDNNGACHDIGDYGYWWSSTYSGSLYAWGRYLFKDYQTINRFELGEKQNGFSVRCVKD